jgi:hypothetical protein
MEIMARRKKHIITTWIKWLRTNIQVLEILANSLLFLSSLLLLIDITPRDFLPSQQQRVRALATLRANHNILGTLPKGVDVRPETSTLRILYDQNTYQILLNTIRERSINVNDVSWKDAIGVGYSTVSVPVADNKLDALHPLYVVQMPTDNSDRFVLVPVGQLEDLEAWVSQRRLTSITRWALLLLTLGFSLQFVVAVLKRGH